VYTVEFEFEGIKVVSLDDTGEHEDVEVYFTSDQTVCLVQEDESALEYTQDTIVISYSQLLDIVTSLQQTEGMYRIKRKTIN
jgi:hypothetical protein|tara:strand:- start:6868 stop:7113 length:246 start_codon:yes stop_codon:yes gene_type:complete